MFCYIIITQNIIFQIIGNLYTGYTFSIVVKNLKIVDIIYFNIIYIFYILVPKNIYKPNIKSFLLYFNNDT